jgi:hypothetical protein
MISRNDIRVVPRSYARGALLKAREFVEIADTAVSTSRWNGAGLASIHAGICAADAALIAAAGVRSASKDHGAVLELLRERVIEFSSIQQRQLAGLLQKKNSVAYDQRLVTDVEARQLFDQAQRLVAWARDVVDAHIG